MLSLSNDKYFKKAKVAWYHILERTSNNIVLVQYICFEQVLISSPEITRFIPDIANDRRYNIAKQHIAKDYTDVSELISLCKSFAIPKKQQRDSLDQYLKIIRL